MTVREYLDFVAELKKVPKKERKQQIDEVMEMTQITDMQQRLIRNLSKGYRQRVGLAQAILGYPEVIILDEPTVGLDPKQIIEIRDLIRKLGENHTVILSSHILSEVSAVCDHIMIIAHGKLVASDSPENLQKLMSGSMELDLEVKGSIAAVKSALQEISQIDRIEENTEASKNIAKLKVISKENADAEIKVCVLNFATKAKWVTAAPVSVEDEAYRWEYVEAGGTTALGDACRELNEALSTKTFMKEVSGSYAPVLFLMSDGEPTDDYRSGIEVLKRNNWFKAAIKVAIGIGNDANKSMLAEFTGSDESVIEVHTPEELKKWIQFVTVTSSQIGSSSTDTSGKNKNEQTGNKIGEEKRREDPKPRPTPKPQPQPDPKPQPGPGPTESDYIVW